MTRRDDHGAAMNPFAGYQATGEPWERRQAMHGNHCPRAVFATREQACTCLPSCAICGGVRMCWCLARYEDLAREQAEEQGRQDDEAAFRQWLDDVTPEYTDDAADRDYEQRRARGAENYQARVDHERGDR